MFTIDVKDHTSTNLLFNEEISNNREYPKNLENSGHFKTEVWTIL
jgi:hypothetical protein